MTREQSLYLRKHLSEHSTLDEVMIALGNCTPTYARRWRREQGWKTYRQLKAEWTYEQVQACKRRGLSQEATADYLNVAASTAGRHWYTPEQRQHNKEVDALMEEWKETDEFYHFFLVTNAWRAFHFCAERERGTHRDEISRKTGIPSMYVEIHGKEMTRERRAFLHNWLQKHLTVIQPPVFHKLVEKVGGEDALRKMLPYQFYEWEYREFNPTSREVSSRAA